MYALIIQFVAVVLALFVFVAAAGRMVDALLLSDGQERFQFGLGSLFGFTAVAALVSLATSLDWRFGIVATYWGGLYYVPQVCASLSSQRAKILLVAIYTIGLPGLFGVIALMRL